MKICTKYNNNTLWIWIQIGDTMRERRKNRDLERHHGKGEEAEETIIKKQDNNNNTGNKE